MLISTWLLLLINHTDRIRNSSLECLLNLASLEKQQLSTIIINDIIQNNKNDMNRLLEIGLSYYKHYSNSILYLEFKNLRDESSSSSSSSRLQKIQRRGPLLQQAMSTKFNNQLTSLMNAICQTKTRHISFQPVIESKLEKTFAMFEVATWSQKVIAGMACHLWIVTDNVDTYPALHVRVF